ncbi:MAG: PorT family protein [Bacteroidales bacterium]|nr:PorT family protein [Bacteroidales bacterium]
MTRKFTVMLICLILSSTLIAQEKAFHFGFKIAPSMSWIKPQSQNYVNEGVRLGFNWGFVGDFYLMENYSLQSGFNILYVNGAYSYPDMYQPDGVSSPITGTTTRELRLKYVQIPAILRMRTNYIDKMAFYGEAGLALAFKTGAKADDEFQGQILTHTLTDQDVSKQYRFSRESLVLGAGMFYKLNGSTRLFGGLRFDNNFFDIIKDQNAVDPKVKQNGIANYIELNIGILL